MRGICAFAAATVVLAAPDAAGALTVEIERSVVSGKLYTVARDTRGESNRLTMTVDDHRRWHFRDPGSPVSGCTRIDDHEVACHVDDLEIDLGAGDDRATLPTHRNGVHVDSLYLEGGDGRDTLTGGAFKAHLSGDAGDDTLRGGRASEVLSGGAGRDDIDGGGGSDQATFPVHGVFRVDLNRAVNRVDGDRLRGIEGLITDFGSPRLTGGPEDNVFDLNALEGGFRVDLGAGDDRLIVTSDFGGSVRCGPGRDVAIVPAVAEVADDCEVVRRR